MFRLHIEVQRELKAFNGRPVGHCLDEARDRLSYLKSDRAREVVPDWMAQKTIWEALWGLFYGYYREHGRSALW